MSTPKLTKALRKALIDAQLELALECFDYEDKVTAILEGTIGLKNLTDACLVRDFYEDFGPFEEDECDAETFTLYQNLQALGFTQEYVDANTSRSLPNTR